MDRVDRPAGMVGGAIHYVAGGNPSRVKLTSTRGRAGKAVLQRLGGNRDLKRFVDELEALGRREPGPREQRATGPTRCLTDRRLEIDLADPAFEFGRQFQASLPFGPRRVPQRRLGCGLRALP